jgi:hypothetical protein
MVATGNSEHVPTVAARRKIYQFNHNQSPERSSRGDFPEFVYISRPYL